MRVGNSQVRTTSMLKQPTCRCRHLKHALQLLCPHLDGSSQPHQQHVLCTDRVCVSQALFLDPLRSVAT